jgi:hypothetical protein
MTRRTWTKAEEQHLIEMKNGGMSNFDIAAALNRSYNSVSVRSSRLNTSVIPQSQFKIHDGAITTQGDALILSDIEAPFQHADFINRVLDLAFAWGIKTLHLAGDLIHYDSLSAWGAAWTGADEQMLDKILRLAEERNDTELRAKLLEMYSDSPLSRELAAARGVFRSMQSFEKIVVDFGNHDDRYLRTIDRALDAGEFLHQIGRNGDDRWQIAPYYYSFIETEKGTFRVTHPRPSGRLAAVDLAVQHHQHIIMGHSHRWSVNRDPSGKYWAIQTGHCVDETRLAYVMQRDAKRDAHVLGATIIRGGYPFVLSPESPFEMLKRM